VELHNKDMQNKEMFLFADRLSLHLFISLMLFYSLMFFLFLYI